MKLQEWINQNEPENKMIYKDVFVDQIFFIRDEIPFIFASSYLKHSEIKNNIQVISTHTSKSIKLPVYQITLPDICFILRNNFHDWKVSVSSDFDIKANFNNLIYPDQIINHIYCEGFKREWVYGPYNNNQSKFTVELQSNHYHLYVFLWKISECISNA